MPAELPGRGTTDADGHGPGWNELADALWLAAITLSGNPSTTAPPTDQPPAGDTTGDAAADSRPPAQPPPAATLDPATAPPRYGAGTTSGLAPAADDADSTAMSALPGGRQLARALKPFKRRILSTTETELDEDATADFAADAGLWVPRYRALQDRWLGLVLIVDDSSSMAVWRPTATALRLLLERHGSFRSVRAVTLCPPTETSGPRVRGPDGGTRSPAELLDPSGRQVYLVFSDGMGAMWGNPHTGRLLRLWGRSGPLAIVNPYPQRHWHRTNLSPRRSLILARRPVTPNETLRVRYPAEFRNPFEEPVAPGSLPVPILELSARWVRWWARLVTTPDPSAWVNGLIHAVDPAPSSVVAVSESEVPRSATELVLGFREGASAPAFRLATYLAVAPLELPLARQVQRSLLPDSAPHHLAEVVTSNLVRPTNRASQALDFADGVREALLACATRDDSVRAVRAVAAYQRRRGHGALTFTQAIEAPDLAPDLPVTPDTLPTARIELAVLDALSGPYAGRARRLRHAIAAVEQGHPQNGSGEPDTRGHGETMATHPDPDRPTVPTYGEPLLAEDDPILFVQTLLEEQGIEAGPAIWGNVPTRNPVFTGRGALLEQLESRLRTQSVAAVLPQALHGEGGVGKSQIAIEYAYRHRAEYDVVWWVPSERPAQILASLIELGERLGLDVGNEVITAVPRVRAALRAGTPYANWLLVFDNAEAVETVRAYFPEPGTGKVLVTSRNQEWSREAETLEVDIFSRSESIRLLRRRNGRLGDADADRLADALGDLPLAIEHASAWLATTGMAVDEYLALLAQKRAELIALVPTPGYELPVAAAANVALDRLSAENPAALQLLQVCSFFAPEPISRDLFAGPSTTPIAPALDEALQDPNRLNQAIRDIQRYVLARIDHRSNSVQLHRLVQAVLQGRMPEELRASMEHGAHVLLAGGGRPGDPSNPASWLRYQALASHLTASNATTCENDWARELVLDLVEFYYRWGDYGSGRDLARHMVDTWRTRLGPDHRQTLEAAKWLGWFWWVEGDFDAASEIHTDSLERFRRTVGQDDEGTIDAMFMVAQTLRVSGRFAASRDLNLDAFQRARRICGEDDPVTLQAANDLGVSLRLTGEFRTARQLDSDTYRRRVAALGDDNPETLRTLNNLTIDERECGEYLRAHKLVERIYQRYMNLFGVGHPETIRVGRNLAVARRRAGDHEGSYKLAEDTMNRFQDRFGEAHPDAIAVALNFAVDIRESDDLPRARALAERTANLYHTSLGSEHPYTLYARTNLGIVLRLLGQHTEAHEHNLTAWRTVARLLGPGHVLTLTCATNLASDRAAHGDAQGAYDLGIDTLSRYRQLVGAEHPTTLACALNVALDLTALGHLDEGTTLFEETLTAYIRVLGENHPAITAARARTRANCDVDPMPF